MRDRVAEVLDQRAALESGAAAGVALSVVLHASAAAIIVYAALHQSAPSSATNVINISLMPITAPPKAATQAAQPKAPVLHQAPPVIEKPKPDVKAEPKTVPLSPFGKSPKKGSETPAPAPATPAPSAPVNATTTAAVPIGGTGATIEGDFPYTLYVQNMNRLIGQHWSRPEVVAGTSVVVSFVIERDGSIHDVKVETPSGNGLYDRSALRAILETSPLPPLPFGYNGTFIGVHLIFK